ncbi:hypothetical protein PHLCEN_2v6768 [Hermanssonia centrifuga]|uniref:Uncharacterized protein n=1 Tax=Hermanssonia centrifuga TaxID=98765 RepID=A0A2R6NYF3_9APHY|nr:hypothetical protein PHLCEN_2v6768 [Hermanssonia centrifuga]
MASQNVLVKDLQGVETLDSQTEANLFQSNNDSTDTASFAIEASGMSETVDIAALNSRIKFDKTDVPFDQRAILGDATETGLIRFAGRYLQDFDGHLRKHPKVFEIPFNSTNKWALVILDKHHEDGVLTAYIKGAPERVLAKCTTYLKDGKMLPITDDFRKAYDEAYNYMASRGHRVIACAQRLLPAPEFTQSTTFSKNDGVYPSTEYCFVSLTSLEDPPKHGVREAIGTLRLAGIKVMMVTGDHPKTAEAIARKINLILGDTKETLSKKTGRPIEEIYEDEVDAVVIHGDDIDGLQGWQWDQIFAKQEIVFARTSPRHKLEIVKRAQALGHIVGVTGDGVNDSPALKKADLGIAMNISGSDVSKEAANMILLDDNFASTVKGVAEGRQIFVNLKRSIQYTISHSTPEVIPQLLYVVVPIPLPLSAILILVIDLGFELFVALSFAWDKPETIDGLMRMSPRKPVNNQSIMSLKKRALRRTKTLRRDTETQEVIRPSRISEWIAYLKAPFTRMWWEERLERSDAETLVDGKLLSYAYLEAGVIEMVGSLVAYFVVFFKNGFSPSDLRKAQLNGDYFSKTSPDFVNGRGQTIDANQQVEALAQAQSIVAFGVLLLVWASIRVLLMRKSVENSRVKDIKGLMIPNNADFEHEVKTLTQVVNRIVHAIRNTHDTSHDIFIITNFATNVYVYWFAHVFNLKRTLFWKAASNRVADEASVINGSLQIAKRPERTGTTTAMAVILRDFKLLFQPPRLPLSQVFHMICIPSAACQATQATRPAYKNQLLPGHCCKPSLTNSKSSSAGPNEYIGDSGLAGLIRWVM